MAITISGANNVDKILATDGVLDSISGFNVVGVMTAGTFDVTGKTTTGHLNVGSNIHIGNAGIITATTLIGNVTGNINHTSNLLLQISGSEKFRVGTSGQLGIGGANYGSAGQVLTSGGSGSAATWSTIASDKITEGNTEAEVVDTGSDGYFKVTTEGSERLRVDASGDVLIGTTDDAIYGDSSGEGIVLRGGECIDINRSGDSMLNLNRLSSDGPYINFRRDGSVKTALSTRSNAFCIDVAGSEKLRVDTSGDVLIGTTDDSVYNNSSGTGVVIRSGDCIDIARNDDNQLFLNRQSGDGYHIAFLRDGSYKSFISTRSNAFCIDVAGSERLRIDSSGHLLLGTTTGGLTDYGDSLTIADANAGMTLRAAATNQASHIYFADGTSGDAQYRGYVQYHHNTDEMKFGTAATERLKITSTGLLLGGSDAQSNTTLGGNAGDSFTGTDAIQNTLIGKDAGTAITSGDQHTAVGYNALKSLTTNASCTAIGAYALEDCTGAGNVAVGYNAMKELTSGQSNTALGFDAATNNTGNYNVAIGRDAMKAFNTNYDDNVTIGAYSAYQATKLYRNVIIGRSAVSQYTGANDIHNNVIIGYQAGYKLGQYAGQNIIIGSNAMNGSNTTTANQYNISNNIVIGQNALQNAKTSTNGCIVMGENAGQNAATGSDTYSYWSHVIAMGKDCLKDATGGSDSIVAIGPNCMEYHTGDGDGSSGGYTVAYGPSAFRNNRHVRHSVAVGNQAGAEWNAVKGAMHEGGCTFIGGGAGRQHSTGTANIAIGRDSMNNVVTGTHNVAVGNRCFERITSGSHNCAVTGLYGALFVSTGDYNNFFGSLSGYAYDTNNATATGDHNNIFGGYSRSSGSNNDHENVFGGGLVGKGANTTYIKGSVYNSNNSSSFSTTSDERIKKNIVDNNTGLDAIEKIRVRNFEYRTKKEITDFKDPKSVVVEDKEGVQLGVIAQEIKDILPDVVNQSTTGAYSVNPDNLTWYLVNAVKELSAEVKSLKAQINS